MTERTLFDEEVHEEMLRAIDRFTAALELRDEVTHDHCGRVSAYAISTAKKLGMSRHEITLMWFKALLHDLGKMQIPLEILNKPGRLTPEEFELMKTHCQRGVDMLLHNNLREVVPGALRHHERLDGKGYPDGLRGDELTDGDKILAIVDAYDAMTGDRPYRSPMAHEEAMLELKRCAGIQFDRRVVAAFEEAVEETGPMGPHLSH